MVDAIVQRFPANPPITLDFVYLHDAPIDDNGDLVEEASLGKVPRAAWEMLYEDGASIVSSSPDGLDRMMTVAMMACQGFGLAISGSKRESMRLQ